MCTMTHRLDSVGTPLQLFLAVAVLSGCPTGIVTEPDAGDDAGSTSGCSKDTDCKGSRICVSKECVDPPTGGGTATAGGGTATTGGGSATTGGGTATTGGGTATTGGGTATTGGGTATTGGGTATTGGGSATTGGGSAVTGGGSAVTGGGSAVTGGGSAVTGGGTAATGGGSACQAESADFYVSPSGSDANSGDLTHPFATLDKLWTVLSPGKLAYLRGGTYQFAKQQFLVGVNGTSTSRIRVWAYPCETPVLTNAPGWTKPGNQWHRGGVYFSGNFFHFRGIEVKGFKMNDGMVDSALLANDSNDCVFEQLNVHDAESGLYVQGNSSNNLVLNSDFHHNYDAAAPGNADGLAIGYTTGTNNVIRGCRAWWNSDDGIDTFENSGHVLLEGNWAFKNGFVPDTMTGAGDGMGFKLGSVYLQGSTKRNVLLRTLKNNVSFQNYAYGIHINGGEFLTEVFNSTLFDNRIGGLNFHYMTLAHVFKNNVSFNNGVTDVEISSASVSSHNAAGNGPNDGNWAVLASAADFRSIVPTGVDGPRSPDGALPVLDFLKLAPGSDLINAGVNVGTPFNGAAPDIGAFEQ